MPRKTVFQVLDFYVFQGRTREWLHCEYVYKGKHGAARSDIGIRWYHHPSGLPVNVVSALDKHLMATRLRYEWGDLGRKENSHATR